MRLLILFALAIFAIGFGLLWMRRKERERIDAIRDDERQEQYRRNLFDWHFTRRLFAFRRNKQLTYRPDDDPPA